MTAYLPPNALCHCGSGLKHKRCHREFDRYLRSLAVQGKVVPSPALLKSPAQLVGIRESGRLNTALLDALEKENILPGTTTQEIDDFVYCYTLAHEGTPAPLGYHGFPKSVCTSVNQQVCHGIPSESVVLQEGDILNVDVSTVYRGYYSDSSRMFLIGEVSPEKKHLVATAKSCITQGLEALHPWGYLGDLAHAIDSLATKEGVSVVREIGGHGIGLAFHEEPWVGYTGKPGTGMLLVPGLVFTIEPMINMGTPGVVTDAKDGWTVTTRDGLPSAQWEVTVAVTEEGYEILAK